jgi:hypothetical protein
MYICMYMKFSHFTTYYKKRKWSFFDVKNHFFLPLSTFKIITFLSLNFYKLNFNLKFYFLKFLVFGLRENIQNNQILMVRKESPG